jgi:hypothetical protein
MPGTYACVRGLLLALPWTLWMCAGYIYWRRNRTRNEAFQRHPEGQGTKLDTSSRFKPGTGFAGMTLKDSFK